MAPFSAGSSVLTRTRPPAAAEGLVIPVLNPGSVVYVRRTSKGDTCPFIGRRGHIGSNKDTAWEEPVGASPTTDTRFRRIYDSHFEAVTRYCLRRLPLPDVNDATAEVFLVAWKRIDRVPDGAEALPWLYGVARNVVRNATRSTRRSGRLTGRLRGLAPSQPPDPSAVGVRRRADEALLTAMAELSDDDQEILRLRAYEGLTAPEIAVALGITPEAAKKRMTRALGRLRKAAAVPQPEVSPHPRAIPEGGER